MTRSLEFSPERITENPAQCASRNCGNRADHECSDCFLQHCSQCVEVYMLCSSPYVEFQRITHQYTCLFCFVDILDNELHGR